MKLSLRALVLLVVLVSREEYPFTVGMADRISLLSCSFLGLLRRARSGPEIVGNVIASAALFLLIECSATVSVLECILAHLSCNFLLFSPRTTSCSRVAAIGRATYACITIIIDPWRPDHACPLRCGPIAPRRRSLTSVSHPSLSYLSAGHWRFARVLVTIVRLLLLSEEKVLAALSSSNL